jgi:hypothetical protein
MVGGRGGGMLIRNSSDFHGAGGGMGAGGGRAGRASRLGEREESGGRALEEEFQPRVARRG